MKRIVLLGSTGSIGVQTLQVVQQHPDEFRIVGLSGWNNISLLAEQVIAQRPEAVWVRDDAAASQLSERLGGAIPGLEILLGEEGLVDLALWPSDQVVVALVGAAGVRPTLAAVSAGRGVALANKETLVVAGHLVMSTAKETGATILPIDSEHSAVFQCLMGADRGELSRIILTASGGPFRNRTWADLSDVTPEEALRHPNWAMGGKITIDSATLMNKGLEVIEAHWLFETPIDDIDVVIHPQSIIHSMVEFRDGSVLGQLGWPDMRLPIQLALTYPRRVPSGLPALSLSQVGSLTFEEVRWGRFPCLSLAIEAGKRGGSYPCVMNAANEVAVHAFLERKTRFTSIPQIIESVLAEHDGIPSPDLADLMGADAWARDAAKRLVSKG